MIQIQIIGSNMADVKAQMREMLGEEHECGCKAKPAPAEAPAKPETPIKAEAPAFKLEDVRKACIAYKDKHGQSALRDVFAAFNAKGLPDVPAEKYAELMERVS